MKTKIYIRISYVHFFVSQQKQSLYRIKNKYSNKGGKGYDIWITYLINWNSSSNCRSYYHSGSLHEWQDAVLVFYSYVLNRTNFKIKD